MGPPGTGDPFLLSLSIPHFRELPSIRSWGKVFDPSHRQGKHAVTRKQLADLNSQGLGTQSPTLGTRSQSGGLSCIIEALERWGIGVSTVTD